MALQDVDDVLTDPDFTSQFDVQRSTVANDAHGRAQQSFSLVASGVIGVVYPATERMLQRTLQGDKQADSITIVTKYRLSPGAQGVLPDIVTWNGAHYTVIALKDWSQYGAGFTEVTCDMLEFAHP